MPTEPSTTAFLLLVVGLLFLMAALTSRFSGKLGLPVALAFLGVGMLCGEDGLGLPFSDFGLAFRIGTVALVLILFDGGLNTPLREIKTAIRPALLLATLGVVVTAAVVAGCAYALSVSLPHALLLGAIVSSTDAASVFSVLRGNNIQLQKRVGMTLELESGLNDPMAVLLTVATTRFLTGKAALSWWLLLDVVRELAIGLALGVGIGLVAARVLSRVRLSAVGLYPALTLAFAAIAFALPTLVHGSGFLAVYVAAVVIGNKRIPYRGGLLRVHDALAWLLQVAMFLVLGLLVTPSKLLPILGLGLVLGLALAFVARPLAALLCLWPFRFRKNEWAYIAWVGLRGAVPIILATYPVLADAKGATEIFHLVFFIVVVNAIIPGSTIGFMTRFLQQQSQAPPVPQAVLEVSSTRHLTGKVLAFYVDKASAAAGVTVGDLPMPPGAAVMVIVRETALLAPLPATRLSVGDHIYVVTPEAEEPLVRLMLGQEEDAG